MIAWRKVLHRVAGEAIEALFPDHRDELAATLAYHPDSEILPHSVYLSNPIARPA